MATVVAVESFVGVLENDVLGEDRIEHHSEFVNQPSVFTGGKYFENGKLQPVGSLVQTIKKPGRKINVLRGQRFDASHPAVKKWPEMFGEVGLHPEVEQATAGPGEKRR